MGPDVPLVIKGNIYAKTSVISRHAPGGHALWSQNVSMASENE